MRRGRQLGRKRVEKRVSQIKSGEEWSKNDSIFEKTKSLPISIIFCF